VLARYARLDTLDTGALDAVLQFMVVWGAKQKFNKLQIKMLTFAKQSLRPRQDSNPGTNHARMVTLRH